MIKFLKPIILVLQIWTLTIVKALLCQEPATSPILSEVGLLQMLMGQQGVAAAQEVPIRTAPGKGIARLCAHHGDYASAEPGRF